MADGVTEAQMGLAGWTLLLVRASLPCGASGPPDVAAATPDTDGVCCKICTRGKACGDTCIAAWKDCKVGPGCACDGFAGAAMHEELR